MAVAIDHPLHDITDTANPFYQAANERTFNVDLVNNTTNAARPDGIIDPSGIHVLSTLVSYPVMARDAFRQSVVDLGVFAKSIAARLDLNGDGCRTPTRTASITPDCRSAASLAFRMRNSRRASRAPR